MTSIARPKSASFTTAPFSLLAKSRFSGCTRISITNTIIITDVLEKKAEQKVSSN